MADFQLLVLCRRNSAAHSLLAPTSLRFGFAIQFYLVSSLELNQGVKLFAFKNWTKAEVHLALFDNGTDFSSLYIERGLLPNSEKTL